MINVTLLEVLCKYTNTIYEHPAIRNEKSEYEKKFFKSKKNIIKNIEILSSDARKWCMEYFIACYVYTCSMLFHR